jgi:hypothetical protein
MARFEKWPFGFFDLAAALWYTMDLTLFITKSGGCFNSWKKDGC